MTGLLTLVLTGPAWTQTPALDETPHDCPEAVDPNDCPPETLVEDGEVPPDDTVGDIPDLALARECPPTSVFACTNHEPMQGPACVSFVTDRTYEPDGDGGCILTDVSQSQSYSTAPEDGCEVGLISETPSDDEYDRCPDIRTRFQDYVRDSTHCCAECSVTEFYPYAVQREDGEWECLPIDADPTTEVIDSVTRGRFCFVGNCSPGGSADRVDIDRTIPQLEYSGTGIKGKLSTWWGYGETPSDREDREEEEEEEEDNGNPG